MVILINNDCFYSMKSIKSNIIDLTITSPPYDNLRNYNGYFFNFEGIAKELYRITKKGRIVVWVVGDATIKGTETGTSFKQALFFKEIGFNLHDTMIYEKDNPPPVGGNKRYYQSFEYMFVFSKGKPTIFNPILVERRNKWNDKRTHRIKSFTRNKNGNFNKKFVKLTGRVKKKNIWKYVVGGGNSVDYGTNHPAGFPEKLVHDHMISWSNKNDLIFDPFTGSGTTAKVAFINNRNFIGCEVSEKYCKSTIRRIENIGGKCYLLQ